MSKMIERTHSAARWILPCAAALLLSACGEDDQGSGGSSDSGLPGELQVRVLGSDQGVQFCEWFESTLPSEDACPRNHLVEEEPPRCLDNLPLFGGCTVEAVERCFATLPAKSCTLPDSEACADFLDCQEEAPPANFICLARKFTCRRLDEGWEGKTHEWDQCWNWGNFSCMPCDGTERDQDWAKGWCEKEHPSKCKNKSCYPHYHLF